MLDNALESETKESLDMWLKEQRNKEFLQFLDEIQELLGEGTFHDIENEPNFSTVVSKTNKQNNKPENCPEVNFSLAA